ncbi:hypothetical protein SDRG_05136 [Saprolegnia diclina VS20]|uniref:START domain-containing protein n=1 Tax=Saprolegnia diclina (strain VS20) TaxID=1156394 RepID=T0QU71_SAPDV|nr:hypothetical protein SDRG_05136 [Saprolegnia diclina VS20]EQC37535.1 hypothetical protein SDRG_05136 [Saprolegnia diclina VS20]|eukprot:XP_008609055.1 hypothetical protein SDRG_05136 [Saprolegnia diclina VS20]
MRLSNSSASSSSSYTSNNSPEDYLALGAKSITDIVAKDSGADKSTSWSHVKDTDGVSIDRGVVDGSAWNAIKATTTVDCAADDLAAKLSDASQMHIFDEMTDNCRVIEALKDSTSIRYVQAKPVFPTTARDFLVVTSQQHLDDGSIVIGTKSVEHDSVPVDKHFVRAHTHVSGYIVRPLTPTSCSVTLIVHMDLGGYMPAAVINLLSVSSPIKLMKRLRLLYAA